MIIVYVFKLTRSLMLNGFERNKIPDRSGQTPQNL